VENPIAAAPKAPTSITQAPTNGRQPPVQAPPAPQLLVQSELASVDLDPSTM
jgi:hypothetical protein